MYDDRPQTTNACNILIFWKAINHGIFLPATAALTISMPMSNSFYTTVGWSVVYSFVWVIVVVMNNQPVLWDIYFPCRNPLLWFKVVIVVENYSPKVEHINLNIIYWGQYVHKEFTLTTWLILLKFELWADELSQRVRSLHNRFTPIYHVNCKVLMNILFLLVCMCSFVALCKRQNHQLSRQ